MVPHEEQNTIAILGGNPVISRALGILLRSVGYEVRLLGEPEDYRVEELLEGVDILLLGSGLGDGYRETFLGDIAHAQETAVIPVLSFPPNLQGGLADAERLVQWPCTTESLAQQIEAALCCYRSSSESDSNKNDGAPRPEQQRGEQVDDWSGGMVCVKPSCTRA